MKNLAIALAAVMVAAQAAAAGTPVYFRSAGPDLYADGSVVRDGEIYALVWSRTNGEGQVVSPFVLDAKCQVVDSDNHAVVARAAIAKNGGCPPNVYLLDDEETALAEIGVFNVYLLDTRAMSAEGGETSVGFAAGGETFCNGYELVPAEIDIEGGRRGKTADDSGEVSSPVTGKNAVATAVPAGARTAYPTAVLKDGGVFYVEVADTEPYIRYALEARESPGVAGVNLANGVNGAGEGKIVLSADATKYRFFKVARSDIRAAEGGDAQ